MLHSEIHGPNWFRTPDLKDPSERCHRNKGTRLMDFFLSGLRDTSTVADATVSRKPISFCLIGVLWPSLFDFRVVLIIDCSHHRNLLRSLYISSTNANILFPIFDIFLPWYTSKFPSTIYCHHPLKLFTNNRNSRQGSVPEGSWMNVK